MRALQIIGILLICVLLVGILFSAFAPWVALDGGGWELRTRGEIIFVFVICWSYGLTMIAAIPLIMVKLRALRTWSDEKEKP